MGNATGMSDGPTSWPVPCSFEILHSIETGTIPLGFHSLARNERRVDAIAQTSAILRTIVKNVTEDYQPGRHAPFRMS
jgi:hypothetical protein